MRLQTDINFAYLQGVGLQAGAGAPGSPPLATEFSVPLNLRAGPSDASVTIESMRVRMEAKLQDGKLRARLIVRYGARGSSAPCGSSPTAWAPGSGAGMACPSLPKG